MRIWTFITVACVFTAGVAALAQEGFKDRSRRSPDAAIAALGLTPEQVTSLRDLRRSQFREMRPIGGEMKELGRQLWEEMSKENPNPSIAGQLLVDMKASRDKIKTLRKKFQDQARGLLDENQQAALTTLESGRKMQKAIREATGLGLLSSPHGLFRGKSGPGGFGGRGPGMRLFDGRRSDGWHSDRSAKAPF